MKHHFCSFVRLISENGTEVRYRQGDKRALFDLTNSGIAVLTLAVRCYLSCVVTSYDIIVHDSKKHLSLT